MAKKSTKKTTKKAVAKKEVTPVVATEAKSKRSLKKVQTVRQKAERASGPRKPRRINRAGSTAAKPFRLIGRLLAKLLRPLGFLLWPFKRRPVRFIGRILSTILLIGYFKGAWQELRQVTWPDRKTTAKLTVAVFVFATVFMLLISVVDYGLDKGFKALFLK